MADDGTVNIPVQATFSGSGFEEASAGAVKLTGDLRNVEEAAAGASGAVSVPVSAPGADETKGKLDELSEGAKEFIDTLKTGVGIDIGERLIEGLGEITDAFKEAVEAGIEYNAEVETSVVGLASSLQSVQPELYKTRDAATSAAKDIFGQVQQFAIDNGLQVNTTLEALSANYNAFVEAGATDLQTQLQFISTVLSAEASKGITGARALIDTIDLLNGKFGRLTFSKEIGLTTEGFKAAAAQGQQLDYIMGHLTGYKAGLGEVAGTFTGLKTSVTDLLQVIAGNTTSPIFAELETALRNLKTELQDPAVKAGLQDIGFEIAEVVHTGAGLLDFAIRNADALANFGQAAVVAGAAIAAVSVKELITGLATYLFSAQAATVATGELAAAQVAEGEAATVAAAGSSRFGAAVGGVVTPVNAAIVAGIALNAYLVKAAADIDAATAAATRAGEAFDKARGSNQDLINDAATQAGYDKRRKALQDEIDAENKIIADGTTQDVVASDGSDAVYVDNISDAAKAAGQRVVELQNRLKELDGVRNASLQTYNVATAQYDAGSQKRIGDIEDESKAEQKAADQVAKAKQEIADETKKQADAQTDLQNITNYLASDEGKRFASDKANEAQLNKLKQDQKADVDAITAAEQKLADLRAKAYPVETKQIADLNAQLKALPTDGTAATADARGALQRKIADLTNTTKGKPPLGSLDDLDAKSLVPPDQYELDQNFLADQSGANVIVPTGGGQGFLQNNTPGGPPASGPFGNYVTPGGDGSIADFTRTGAINPDVNGTPDADYNLFPQSGGTSANGPLPGAVQDDSLITSFVNEATQPLDATSQNTDASTQALQTTNDALKDASLTLKTTATDSNAAASDLQTNFGSLQDSVSKQQDATTTGLQSLTDAHASNTSALISLCGGLISTVQDQGSQIAQLQLRLDNVANSDN